MSPGRRLLLSGVLSVATACGGESLPRQATAAPGAARLGTTHDPAELATALGVHPESLHAAAEERYARQSYDSARTIWQTEVARASRARDSASIARATMWAGLAAWRLGDYAAARHEGEASLALKRRLGLDAELARSYNALGLLAWNEGRHGEALTLFDSAVATSRRNGDAAGIARAASNIPLVRVELGDYDGAREGLRAALAAGRAVGDDRILGNALANLAMLEIRLGSPAKALPLLATARRHYAAINYVTGEANALGQLATARAQLGDLQHAITAADSGLLLARRLGLKQEMASTLGVLADLHVQAGSPQRALRRLAEADSLGTELGLLVERGNNLRRASIILLALGESRTAAARAGQALAAHRAVDARAEMVHDRLQLALAHARVADDRSARAQVDSAARDARRLSSPAAVRDVAVTAARLALDGGDPRRALAALAGDPANESTTEWRVADLRAEALHALGRLEDARREAQRAITLLERERATLGHGPLRSAYFTSRSAPFARLVAIQLARGDTAGAFSVAVSLPGRTLAEHLGGDVNVRPGMHLLAERERLLRRAAALEQALVESEGDEPREPRLARERSLAATRAAYEDHLVRHASVPDAGMLAPSATTLDEVQSQLAEADALVAYLAGPSRLELFVVRRRTVIHRSVNIGDRELATRVSVARDRLAAGVANPDAIGLLRALHELVLRPALDAGALTGVDRLLVLPHGSLGAVPFAALWNPQRAQYVVESMAVVHLPSIGTLRAFRARPAARVGMVVVAPLSDSLPGTRDEARTVAKRMPNTVMRVGRSVREADTRGALAAGRSLHLASHGEHNSHNPLFSRMIVGRQAAPATADDGRLEVHEILALETASPLVFLSGCETGLGHTGLWSFAAGGDQGSLAQAFHAAGAQAVVATLWRVDDAAAVFLADAFYRHLQRGVEPDVALALAQRDRVAADGDLTWAAYTVSVTGSRKTSGTVRTTGEVTNVPANP